MDEELKPQAPGAPVESEGAAAAVSERARTAKAAGRMPAIDIGHGAPPLVDDTLWVAQLAAWAAALPRPEAVMMVSAHWENAPLTLGATRAGVPLIYDFGGFPERYYRAQTARRGRRRWPARSAASCPISGSKRSPIAGSTTAPTSR